MINVSDQHFTSDVREGYDYNKTDNIQHLKLIGQYMCMYLPCHKLLHQNTPFENIQLGKHMMKINVYINCCLWEMLYLF